MEKIFDYILGASLFFIAFIFIVATSVNYISAPREDLTSLELKEEAHRLSLLLINSEGEPRTWEYSSPEVLGLAYYDGAYNETREFALVKEKIDMLNSSRLGYEAAGDALATDKKFNIQFKNNNLGWFNSSFIYRQALLNSSNNSSNGTANLDFPRGNCYFTTLRITNQTGDLIPFENTTTGYYDSDSLWIKNATLSFETDNSSRYLVYYSPDRGIQNIATTTISNPDFAFYPGKEEKNYDMQSFGQTPPSDRSMVVSERIVAVQGDFRIAYVGDQSYEINLLKEKGYHFDVFDNDNISLLFDLAMDPSLYSYGVMIIGSHAVLDSTNIDGNLSGNNQEIFKWVRTGGAMIIFGQDQASKYTWMAPFGIEGVQEGGVNQTLKNLSLKILRYTNNLTWVEGGSGISTVLGNNTRQNHPSNAQYTFWSRPKAVNLTYYSRVDYVAVNHSNVTNSSIITNGDFSNSPLLDGTWNQSTTDGAQLTNDYNNGEEAIQSRIDNQANVNETGNWSQDWYYGGRPFPDRANLSFRWRCREGSNIEVSTLYVYITSPRGSRNLVWQGSYSDDGDCGNVAFNSNQTDVANLMNQQGWYRIELVANLNTGSGPGQENNRMQWDDVMLNTTYSPEIFISGNLGDGLVMVTGDEPSYTGHTEMMQNMVEHAYSPGRFTRHIYKMVVKVW